VTGVEAEQRAVEFKRCYDNHETVQYRGRHYRIIGWKKTRDSWHARPRYEFLLALVNLPIEGPPPNWRSPLV
jgi:hypothetical protein